MKLPLYHVDAFTAHLFKGNPAAVCLLDALKPDAWMQSLAQEMNLSETAFLLSEGEDYSLRWFTPAVEVDLCGHATLATAHVLFETGRLALDGMARFHTRSGLLTAVQANGWIEMDFPSGPVEPVSPPALGIQARPHDLRRIPGIAARRRPALEAGWRSRRHCRPGRNCFFYRDF